MDRELSAKEKRHVVYITLMGLAILFFVIGIAFSLKMRNGEGIMGNVIPLVVSLGFINYWYFKSEKFFVDPYESYNLKDHIIKNGIKYKGNVVHIAEKYIVEIGKTPIKDKWFIFNDSTITEEDDKLSYADYQLFNQ